MPLLEVLTRPFRRPIQQVQRAAQATALVVGDFFSRDVTLDSTLGLLVPPELKPILVLSEAEIARQREILKSRAFHEGNHGVKLTERLKEFLGEDADDLPCLNFTQTVTMAVTERLKVERLECDDAGVLAWAQRVWDDSRMLTKQSDVWEETGVDGEHFILVNWNPAGNGGAGEVELIPHPRYLDPTSLFDATAGDGYGMAMVYPGGDTSRRPLYAIKRSTEELEGARPQKQLTIYRPGEIARYYLDAKAGWMPLRETDMFGEPKAWPEPWLSLNGKPLGIPVVHLKNPRLRPEAKQAQKLQRSLNKLYLDFLIANDESAFRIWLYAGWDPSEVSTAPGSWIGSPTAKKEDGFFAEAVEGSDTTPMLTGIEKVMGWIAMVTSTPLSRLTMTGQIARAETQQQEEQPLGAKVENRQESFGQGLTDAFRIGARIQNRFGAQTGARLSEDARVKPKWKPFSRPIVNVSSTNPTA